MSYQKEKLEQRRDLINYVTKKLNMYSPISTELILGTGIIEGNNFNLIKQLENGVAKSAYQIEPATHNDNFKNYLIHRPKLARNFLELAGEKSVFKVIDEDLIDDFIKDYIESEMYTELAQTSLMYNEAYAIAHCRLKYYRSNFKMPQSFDIEEIAKIWKEHYNTNLGKGSVEKFIEEYNYYTKL